ncbi:MAG: hypothetical protein ABW128_02645 [Rhizorhabdus sp.]
MKKFVYAASAASLVFASVASVATAAVVVVDPTPAADPADLTPANLALAQAQCDAAAAAADLDGPGVDSDRYTAEVVEGAVTLASGPTEIGTHTIDNAVGPITPGIGATFHPADPQITTDPYRNGGSVNMFGLQQSGGGTYSTSNYNFEGEFQTVYAHAYTCTISFEDYHPAVHNDRVGHWIINPDFNGNEEQVTENCEAFNTALPGGPANGHPTDQANCRYIEDQPASDEPAFYDDPEVVATGVPGGSFDQSQTDTLLATETAGESYFDPTTVTLGQVVICISPSKTGTKLPGAWAKQNGYTGSLCTTEWYNGGAKLNVPNLNDGSHNFVTVPVV